MKLTESGSAVASQLRVLIICAQSDQSREAGEYRYIISPDKTIITPRSHNMRTDQSREAGEYILSPQIRRLSPPLPGMYDY